MLLLKISIGILLIAIICCFCALIFSLYMASLPPNKQDETLDNIQTSSEKLNKTFIDKFFCCFTIFKKHFQITSNDFILRFINSFISFKINLITFGNKY